MPIYKIPFYKYKDQKLIEWNKKALFLYRYFDYNYFYGIDEDELKRFLIFCNFLTTDLCWKKNVE